MKKHNTATLAVVALIVVALSGIAFATIDIETYKAPAQNSILDQLPGRLAEKATVVDAEALAFLDVFPYFSLGVMVALDELLPITSWDQLVEAVYTSINRARQDDGEMGWSYGENPRKIMSKAIALTFYMFFELDGEFIWIAADVEE